MKAPGLPADQQFFADLFSGLVLNPQLLGRVWFASQPASLPGALNIRLSWKKMSGSGKRLLPPALVLA